MTRKRSVDVSSTAVDCGASPCDASVPAKPGSASVPSSLAANPSSVRGRWKKAGTVAMFIASAAPPEIYTRPVESLESAHRPSYNVILRRALRKIHTAVNRQDAAELPQPCSARDKVQQIFRSAHKGVREVMTKWKVIEAIKEAVAEIRLAKAAADEEDDEDDAENSAESLSNLLAEISDDLQNSDEVSALPSLEVSVDLEAAKDKEFQDFIQVMDYSRILRENMAELCARCHLDLEGLESMSGDFGRYREASEALAQKMKDLQARLLAIGDAEAAEQATMFSDFSAQLLGATSVEALSAVATSFETSVEEVETTLRRRSDVKRTTRKMTRRLTRRLRTESLRTQRLASKTGLEGGSNAGADVDPPNDAGAGDSHAGEQRRQNSGGRDETAAETGGTEERRDSKISFRPELEDPAASASCEDVRSPSAHLNQGAVNFTCADEIAARLASHDGCGYSHSPRQEFRGRQDNDRMLLQDEPHSKGVEYGSEYSSEKTTVAGSSESSYRSSWESRSSPSSKFFAVDEVGEVPSPRLNAAWHPARVSSKSTSPGPTRRVSKLGHRDDIINGSQEDLYQRRTDPTYHQVDMFGAAGDRCEDPSNHQVFPKSQVAITSKSCRFRRGRFYTENDLHDNVDSAGDGASGRLPRLQGRWPTSPSSELCVSPRRSSDECLSPTSPRSVAWSRPHAVTVEEVCSQRRSQASWRSRLPQVGRADATGSVAVSPRPRLRSLKYNTSHHPNGCGYAYVARWKLSAAPQLC